MARLAVVWLHVVGAVAWVGGLLYAGHLVVPAASRGARDALALLRRGRVVSWAAVALVIVSGLENLRSMTVITPWLAGKLLTVIALLALAAHRDFALLPRAVRSSGAASQAGRCRASGCWTGSSWCWRSWCCFSLSASPAGARRPLASHPAAVGPSSARQSAPWKNSTGSSAHRSAATSSFWRSSTPPPAMRSESLTGSSPA